MRSRITVAVYRLRVGQFGFKPLGQFQFKRVGQFEFKRLGQVAFKRAPRVLAQYGPQASIAVPELVKRAYSSEEGSARAIGLVLRKIDPNGKLSIPLLTKEIRDGSASNQIVVLKTLGAPEAISAVIQMDVYYSTGIENMGKTLPIDLLISKIQDPNAANPSMAMSALAFSRVTTEPVIAALRKAMVAEKEETRFNAATALLFLTKHEDPLALKLANQSLSVGWDISPTVEDVIAEFPSPPKRLVEDLIKRVDTEEGNFYDPRPLLLLAAAKGSMEAESKIIALLQTKEGRSKWINAFGQALVPPSRSILEVLKKIDNGDDYYYASIQRVFLEIGTPESLQMLEQSIKRPSLKD